MEGSGTATRSRPLTHELRLLLWAFAALALIAGVLLFVLADDTDRFFSWTIKPPLTAAFLGASYWAAFVLLAWTASQREWARARAAFPPVVTIAVLLLVATLVHIDRFDFDSVFGWFWLTVYILVPPALAALLALELRLPGSDPSPRASLPAWVRAVLGLQAVVMLGIGIALFVAPTDADSLWPWMLSPLTARAIGAFVVGFGLSALHAAIEGDLARFSGAALAYTALGALELLALAIHSSDLDGGSADTWIYVAFLATVLGIGLYASARARNASRLSSTSS